MNFDELKKKKICMIGFGAQAKAEARNLKRSGIGFKLGLRKDSPSLEPAQAEGFSVCGIEDVLQDSEICLLNIPDQEQPRFYTHCLKKSSIKYVVYAHGFSIHFGLIEPTPTEATSVLIAPKGAASGLENFYGTENALPAILAFQSPTRSTASEEERKWIEELALAMGCHSKALIWAQFKDETVCDLFSEQSLLCGGVSELLKLSFECLTEAGYQKETAYFETLFELKLIVDLIWKKGISGMRDQISPTARYGDLTRGSRIIDSHVKNKMKEVLAEIESGQFAREFLEKVNSKEYLSLVEESRKHPIEGVGNILRKKMRNEPNA